MRIFLLLIALTWFGCSDQKTENMAAHDPAMHEAGGMVLDSDSPVLGNLSLYQVESSWTNQANVVLQLSSLAGKPQVVAMTYTSCEVSCPRIVAAMQQIQRNVAPDAGFVLISIDPARDTVLQLKTYAEKMKLEANSWNLLTGTNDDVREMAALLGVRYQEMPDGEFAHSNIITVLDQDGVIYHQQNGIASDLTKETQAQLAALIER